MVMKAKVDWRMRYGKMIDDAADAAGAALLANTNDLSRELYFYYKDSTETAFGRVWHAGYDSLEDGKLVTGERVPEGLSKAGLRSWLAERAKYLPLLPSGKDT